MPVEFAIVDGQHVRVTVTGRSGGDEATALLGALASAQGYRPGMPFLVDYRAGEPDSSRAVQDVSMDVAGRMELVRPLFGDGARVAFVVQTDAQYGWARGFGAWAGDALIQVEVFRDEAEAAAWIAAA